jgi:hypothetical protein
MLLHYILHWPQEARLDLWPYAIDYAVWLWNNIPDLTTSLSPLEVFSKATFPDHNHLQRTRVFGCPVYVLHPTLQDDKKLPKWQRKSWKDIFSDSPNHSTNVALVLNPETGSITPQYHVVFDEKFSTTSSNVDTNLPTSTGNHWDSIFDGGHDKHDCLQGPSRSQPSPDAKLDPPLQADDIEIYTDKFPDSKALTIVPSNDTLPDAVSPDIHLQVQPDTESELNHPDIVPDIDSEFTVESETTNVSSKTTIGSIRQVRPPKHLRDFVLL